MTDDERIDIESTRAGDGDGPACLLRWRGEKRYASVEDVRRTAEDLFTCAAFADMIGELMRVGLPADAISGLSTAMIRDRQPRYFGTPQTIFLLPVGSSRQQQGAVGIGRRNQFHRGEFDGVLTAAEAREMGRVWLQSAEASEADTLFSAALRRAGWLADTELDALFGLVADVRSGKARATAPTGVRREGAHAGASTVSSG